MASLPGYGFRKRARWERPRRIAAGADLKQAVVALDDLRWQAGQSGKYPNGPGSALKGGWTI